MEKVIDINGKSLRLVSNAFLPILYKRQFGKDIFADMIKLAESDTDNFDTFDIELIYNVAWCMARLADNKIPVIDEWLTWFDEFPIVMIAEALSELLSQTFLSKNMSAKNAEAVQRANL